MTKTEAVEKLRALFRGSHWVDLRIRRNGKWEDHEGDWLRIFLDEPEDAQGGGERG